MLGGQSVGGGGGKYVYMWNTRVFLLTWELVYWIQNENCLPRTFLDSSWAEKSVAKMERHLQAKATQIELSLT